MINLKTIYRVLGSLLMIEALLLALCCIMAFYYGEDDMPAFAITVVFTMIAGFSLQLLGRNADNSMSRRDAYLVVTLSWIIFSVFGMLPFLISGYITNVASAFFETMSGFTTTGATIIDDVEALPHGLLFWRSTTQWIGGLGIVFFTIAILPSFVGGSVRVFGAEATGPIKTRLHPRLSTNAKWIWSIYLVLTIACIFSFWGAGMSLFDSVNYAMGTTATGGFSPHNDSIEFFQSPLIEYLATLFCFLSGINFTLLYTSVIKMKPLALWKNTEFKFYLSMAAGFTLFIMFELMWHNSYDLEKAFRCASFEVVSFMTTTGLFNDDAAQWPHVTWVVLAACMFFGGCSGSTSGGFKSIRGVMLLKNIKNEFTQLLHPNAVLSMKINDINVPQQKRVTLLAFLTVYLMICLISSFFLIASGIDNTNAITIILSCIGNVGPTLGLEIGPTMSWSELPDYIKWFCSILMLIGRLEIFSVLVIFTPIFWQER